MYESKYLDRKITKLKKQTYRTKATRMDDNIAFLLISCPTYLSDAFFLIVFP